MRGLTMVAAVAAAALLAACAARQARPRADSTPSPPASEPVPASRSASPPAPASRAGIHELRFDEPLVLEDGELVIEWLEIQDSRCPRGTTCVWVGEVGILISVAEQGQPLERKELALRVNDEAAAWATTPGHEIHLLRVSPYPTHGVETERAQHVARLDVRPRG